MVVIRNDEEAKSKEKTKERSRNAGASPGVAMGARYRVWLPGFFIPRSCPWKEIFRWSLEAIDGNDSPICRMPLPGFVTGFSVSRSYPLALPITRVS